MPDSREEPASATLLRLVTGYRLTQAVYVATKLGIPDRLAAGPRGAAELAQEAGADPDRLFRLLRVLASVGVLTMDAAQRFGLTPTGELLRSDAPGSLAAFVLLQGEEPYRAFEDLLYTIRTGGTAFDHRYGMGHFDYLGRHPEASAVFNRAMSGSVRGSGNPFAGYDFGRHHVLVDVGGGRGTLLASVLRAHPRLRGVLFDLPSATADAPAHLAAAGVAERCEIRSGSAFESVPPGGDVYVMSRILHDWPDEKAEILLRNCRAAMPPDGTLLLVEGVLPEGIVSPPRAQLDLMMMVMNGGRERTEGEWRRLLEAGGFSLRRVHTAPELRDLIEATPR